MDETTDAKIDKLKQDYLEIERLRNEEKNCFLQIINTFGNVMSIHPEFSSEFQAVKNKVNTKQTLPVNQIVEDVKKLRSKIYAAEIKKEDGDEGLNQGYELPNYVLKACEIIKDIRTALSDDFYPLSDEVKTETDIYDIECHEEMKPSEIDDETISLLTFISKLKYNISQDFKYINDTFHLLLEHVKELDKTLANEFGENQRIQEIKLFEKNIGQEISSISDSFDIHETIDEIKNAVVAKLSNIKQLVAKKKEEELRKAQITQSKINNLTRKIAQAEKNRLLMSQKTKHLTKMASKDGLTGLYNRRAFDMYIKNALDEFNKTKELLALVIFDVDNFKWVNDTLGHVAGDKVLQSVAKSLKEIFRKDDFIVRYGGDEFTVVINNLNEELAKEKIVNFETNFSEKQFFSNKHGYITITISAGITFAKKGDSPEDLINKADMKMLEVKKKKKRNL